MTNKINNKINVVSTSAKDNLNKEKTEVQKLQDRINELEATNKTLQQIVQLTTPIIKIILPHLKNRPEINQESLQTIELMLQVSEFLSLDKK